MIRHLEYLHKKEGSRGVFRKQLVIVAASKECSLSGMAVTSDENELGDV